MEKAQLLAEIDALAKKAHRYNHLPVASILNALCGAMSGNQEDLLCCEVAGIVSKVLLPQVILKQQQKNN